MKTLFKDQSSTLEIAIIDEWGDFVSGLTVNYEVRDTSNTLIVSGLTSVVNNVYTFSYTFDTNGQYRLKYLTPSEYENGFEQLKVVDNYIESIKLILGLDQSNFRIKDQVYNANNQLLSSTIRLYDNATDTNNDVNPIKEYFMTATYDGNGLLTSYKVTE